MKEPKPLEIILQKPLTPKQRRYVDCYDGDVKRSANEAGISYQYAKELHTKTYYAHVMIALIEVNEAVSKASIMSKQERQEFWTAMTKTAEKDSDKLKASELLGRSCADFIDKREIIFPGIGAIDLTTLILKVTEKNEQQPG